MHVPCCLDLLELLEQFPYLVLHLLDMFLHHLKLPLKVVLHVSIIGLDRMKPVHGGYILQFGVILTEQLLGVLKLIKGKVMSSQDPLSQLFKAFLESVHVLLIGELNLFC